MESARAQSEKPAFTVDAAALGTAAAAASPEIGLLHPNPAALPSTRLLALGYYRSEQVGVRGAELRGAIPIRRITIGVELQHLTLEEVVSEELARQYPELAGLGVSATYLTAAASWRISPTWASGIGIAHRQHDVLGERSTATFASAGASWAPHRSVRLGFALGVNEQGTQKPAEDVGVTAAVSYLLPVKHVPIRTFAGFRYGAEGGRINRWNFAADVRPTGPLSVIGGIEFVRQPFREDSPFERAAVAGIGLRVGRLRVQLAQRWREEALGTEVLASLLFTDEG